MSLTADQQLRTLGRLRQLRRQPRAQPAEECGLCRTPLPPEHDHLFEVGGRRLLCACRACALLFSDRQNGRFRRVLPKAELLTDFELTDAQWDGLLIPIDLAFFFLSSMAGRVLAFYPSPAGATESQLQLDAWQALSAANPLLGDLQPDVEALLVNRTAAPHEYYLVSLDCCYELVGLLRLKWKGLSGGNDVWNEIHAFFERLRTTATRTGRHD
ncbi:MAG TPA: DUF5947 family protein [Pirellulales bacterium]|nr:DUF5947 family protein [Pirellulales bacterium]